MNATTSNAQNERDMLDQQDDLRIRSGDLWSKIQAIGFFRNLLPKLQDSDPDRDCWSFPAHMLRTSEISDIHNAQRQRSKRRKQADTIKPWKEPPEFDQGDSAEDILEYLYKKNLFRAKMVEIMGKLLENRQAELQLLLKKNRKRHSPLQQKMQEAKELFGLSELEGQIILFLFLHDSGFWNLGSIFDSIRFRQESNKLTCLANALNLTELRLTQMLNSKGNLRRFEVLEASGLELADNFKDFLCGYSDIPLCERYYSPFTGNPLPWDMHGRIAAEDGSALIELVQARQPGKGQNILFYGAPGTGKTAFAQSLAAKLGKKLVCINQTDSSDSRGRITGPGFRFAGIEVANLRLDPEKTIVCVDECDKMIAHAGASEGLFQLLGVPADRDGEGKGQLNSVMDSLKLTVIWIANTMRDAIDPSSRRRFDYNVYFDSLNPAARRHIWENALTRFGVSNRLSPEFLTAACNRYPVNAGGISLAVSNAAAILRLKPDADFPEAVLRYLRPHCNILNIVDNLDGSQPARDYSLDGLNLKTGASPERIISACRQYLASANQPGATADSPRLNLLLFGAPGTGKTEFVKFLAQQLHKPLNVKMASDLLNCYVGGTEQRIASAFREAAAENSILFIDEGDSMLGSRAKATRSWEMTQVTTLLNQMENFAGIFIMATNFANNLDPAAIRRFTFKLHFDYLNAEGKILFYNRFFQHLDLPELSQADRQNLANIAQLTPGDFRNVRQQFFYLASEQLSNAEMIKALADEAANKQQCNLATSITQPNKIGFDAMKKSGG